MSRGEDRNSWAHKMTQTLEHKLMLFVRAEKSLDELRKEILEQHGVVVGSYYAQEISTGKFWPISTGTQSASGGPAKPSLVGSTPTPCSNICNRVRCPDCTTCAVVDMGYGVHQCNHCSATFTTDGDAKAGETICIHLVSPFSCTICYPRKLTTHICSLAPAQMQEGDDCLACKQKMEAARIKAIYT